MPETLSVRRRGALQRCERPPQHLPEDHDELVRLHELGLVTTRRGTDGAIYYRLTTAGEAALDRGWY